MIAVIQWSLRFAKASVLFKHGLKEVRKRPNSLSSDFRVL